MTCSKDHPLIGVLRDHCALRNFEKLIKLGCDKIQVLSCLHCLREAFPEIDDLKRGTGLDQRGLKRMYRKIRKVADEIELLNSRTIGFMLLNSPDAKYLIQIPRWLRHYALNLECYAKTWGPQKRPAQHACKFFLVKHINERTGKWHDEDVSALLAAVLDVKYSPEAHKMWREQHYLRLSKARSNT